MKISKNALMCVAAAVALLAAAASLDAQSYSLKAPFAGKPALLTSIGQSADAEMVKVLLDRSKIKYQYKALAKPADLAGVKTLIVAVGGSSKGLGAAGIRLEEEIERTNALIKKARELKLSIIAVHVGGEGRRGELSDSLIQAAFPAANYALVVQEGDKDGLFSRLAEKAGIPLDLVPKISAIGQPLARAFLP